MIKQFLKILILPFIILSILSACATKIKLEVEKLPDLNTSGIRRIAIMPFETASNNVDYRRMAQYATGVVNKKILETDYFTLVDPSIIQNLKNNNQSIENYADAVFYGRITSLNTISRSNTHRYRDREGKLKKYTTYYREADIEFNYYLVRAIDGSKIGPVYFKGRKTSSGDSWYSIKNLNELLRSVIDDQLRNLLQNLAPYKITENRRLAKEKSKEKVLLNEMKEALAFVKTGNNRTALNAYLDIYSRNKNMAAAENASILYEALGDAPLAAEFLQRVYEETGNPKAEELLARLEKILSDKATLISDYYDGSN